MNKAIFLDRDGVIIKSKIVNHKPFAYKTINEIKIITGVKKYISLFKKEGWKVIVITNQPDVKYGHNTFANVEKINKYLKNFLSIDEFYVCYHGNKDNCKCRKPKCGLFFKAKKKYDIDFNLSYMIGDRWSDVKAGNSAGCKTFFIDYFYNEKLAKNYTYKVKSFTEAAKIILKIKNKK
jgi:D-glycero-D-manno-heptose 1,7-bisphosphate phosphatase